ncbi:MAG: hypothetical protein U0232_01895 [Thermomicrobiales bacterium]
MARRQELALVEALGASGALEGYYLLPPPAPTCCAASGGGRSGPLVSADPRARDHRRQHRYLTRRLAEVTASGEH